MRNTIDMLTGSEPIGESTTTASMPATVTGSTIVASPAVQAKPRRAKLSDLLLKKKVQQEDSVQGDKPVIPHEAKKDDLTGDLEHPAEPKGENSVEPFIPTSVALVAPDTTPNSEQPLDPGQVPQPSAAINEPTPSMSSPTDNGSDVMRTLIGQHQAQFKPTLVTNPTEALAAVQSALNGSDTPKTDVSAKAAATAARVLAEAQAGKKPEPHYNPNSMNQAAAAARMIMGG